MDTGDCYRVKKCAEIAFRKGRMIKGGLAVLEETMDALDPPKMRFTKFLDVKRHIKSM